MLTYDLSKRHNLPIYEYLYTCIKQDIILKRLKSGEKLPSKRQLASHLKISVITVENAYAQLAVEGYIYSIEKKGYFVCELEDTLYVMTKPRVLKAVQPAKKQYILDLSSNRINENLFPFSVWSKLMRISLLEKDTNLLKSIPYNGIPELREAISEYLYKFRGLDVSKDQIIIGAGTEYLYTLLIQLLGKESIFVTENPGYKKISRVFTSLNARWTYNNLDKNGLSINHLKNMNANIVHTSPSHHYPTGIVMPVSRRRELLNWAYSLDGRYIIEDDYDSEFRFNSKPLPTLTSMDVNQKVIYINTFSKTMAPSMRISYMVLPFSLMEKYNRTLSFYSCTVPSFDQYTLAKFISDGYFEKHINRMKNSYKYLRDETISIIKSSGLQNRITITEKDAGLHFLINVKTSLSDCELKQLLLNNGVKVNFLSDYSYDNDPSLKSTIVFNYSGINTKNLKQALDIIEKLI